MEYIPYTYLIGWSKLNLWYYGVRVAKGCNPNDLWKSYFTSSKYVKEIRTIHGDPDVIEVRKEFNSSKDASEWEQKVLIRLGVVHKEKWLNKCANFSYYVDKQTKEHIKKRTSNKKHHPNQKQFALRASQISAEKRRGSKDSEETKSKRNESLRRTLKAKADAGISRSKRKQYLIEGKVHSGLSSIMEEYGFTMKKVYYRLDSPKFPDWQKLGVING